MILKGYNRFTLIELFFTSYYQLSSTDFSDTNDFRFSFEFYFENAKNPTDQILRKMN